MVGTTHVNNGAQVYYLGTGTSFNVSGIPGYQNLTADNFVIDVSSLAVHANVAGDTMWGSATGNIAPVKTYNAASGILTISNLTTQATAQARCSFKYSSQLASDHYISGSGTATITPKVYLIKGKIKNI